MLPVICILGPTASGKTQLALDLAEQNAIEIISVDSAQVYREMNIGTAKPSQEILRRVPHHLIDICDPSESYSGGRFCAEVLELIPKIQTRGALPVLVGGTMLYFNLLRQGYSELPSADLQIREKIKLQTEQHGLAALYEQLKQLDPLAAQRLKPQDTQRIQRALELYHTHGTAMSTLHASQVKRGFPYPVVNFIILPNDRTLLHQRIAHRFDEMLNMGFVKEVEVLYQRGDLNSNMSSIRTVGYRQIWDYLQGKISYELMRDQAIAATRQLAKRQLTWLRQWDSRSYYAMEDKNLLNALMKLL